MLMPIDDPKEECRDKKEKTKEKPVEYDIVWRRSVNTVNARLGFCLVVEEVRMSVFVNPKEDPREEKAEAMGIAKLRCADLEDILKKDARRVLCEKKGDEEPIHFSENGEDGASDSSVSHGATLSFPSTEIAAWPCSATPSAEELAKILSVPGAKSI